jgi:hypothetical protein
MSVDAAKDRRFICGGRAACPKEGYVHLHWQYGYCLSCRRTVWAQTTHYRLTRSTTYLDSLVTTRTKHQGHIILVATGR